MRNLFAYGTLMCDGIIAEVAGMHLSSSPGRLCGYRRLCVKNEHYPALVPDGAGCVDGVVYLEIPREVWDRLDQFEGEMYSREVVEVRLVDGLAVRAATYVARDEFRGRLENTEWDFEMFLRKYKESFRRSYLGYRAIK